MKKKIFTSKIILIILIISLSLTSILLIYNEIIKKSYFSYAAGCSGNPKEFLKGSGFVQSGSANLIPIWADIKDFNISNPSNQEIPENATFGDLKCVISVINDNSQLIAHEICHCDQFDERRLFSCNEPVSLFLNEVECYVKQNFWWLDKERIEIIREEINL